MAKIDEIKMLRLGQRDENLARSLTFDCSDWLEQYPEASIHILFRRPGESAIVPMSTTLEGTTLTWLIHDFEVGKTGVGNAEFRAVDTAGLRRKSRIIPCSIEETLLGDDETVLYTQDQVDETLAHISEAAQAAQAAQASEEAAALSAQEAGESAASAGTAADVAVGAKDAAQAAQTAAEIAQHQAEAAQSGVHADAEAAEQAKVTAQAAQASAQGAASQASADRTAAESARADAEAAAEHAEEVVEGIDQAGADQVEAVNAAGQAQVTAVNAAGTTQVGNVNTAGTTQVNAVQAKGTQVINSIPADYSTLSSDVTVLKSALNNAEQKNLIVPVDEHQIIQGTYNLNGSVQSSNTRIRTSGFMSLYKGQIIKFQEGTNIKQFFFGFRAAGSTGNFTDGGIWYNSGTEIEIPANRDYIFVFRKGISDSITPEEYDAVLSILNANAKAINDFELKFDGYTPLITKEAYGIPLEQGRYRTTAKTEYVLNRVKTKMPCYAKNQYVEINCPDGFEYSCMYWDETQTYKGEDSATSSGNTIKRIPEAYFGINIKKSSGENIVPSELDGFTIRIADLKEKNVTIEQGVFNSDGSLSVHYNNYLQYTRTSFFIKTNGATTFTFNRADIRSYTVMLYDNAFGFLSSSSVTGGSKLFTIPTTATYFKVELAGVGYGDSIKIYYVADGELEEKKNVQISTPSERLIFDVGGDDCSTAMLILPPNYTPDGKPVPLCYYLDGSGSAGWGETFKDAVLHQVQYCAAEGFAVASIYAWGREYNDTYSGCRASYPYPVPTHKHIIKKGIEYICSRFNVDINNVHLMSESQGGQLALYFATVPPKYMTIKSIGMFSPVLDYLSMPGESLYTGVRSALVHELGLENDTDQSSPTYDPDGTSYFTSADFSSLTTRAHNFIIYNKDKFIGLNEAWVGLVGGTADERFAESFDDAIKFWGANWQTGMAPDTTREDIYTHGNRAKVGEIPVRIWGAHDDNSTPYMKMVEAVKQLTNGGCEAKLITFPNDTGKHGAPGHGNYVESVVTRYGGTFTNVPGGWYQNVQWAYEKMAIEDR